MEDFLAEAYTLECGLILTWVGQDGDPMPDRDVMLPVWASKKMAEILRKEFARRCTSIETEETNERKLFAQGLWCQIYAPSDYMALDVAFNVQRLVASLVANQAQGSIYGGLTKSIKAPEVPTSHTDLTGLSSAVRIVPIGLLGTAGELIRVQQANSPTLVFSAIGAILKRALKVPEGISFMCLPRFFFGEELVKTALLLEDLFVTNDDDLLESEVGNEAVDEVSVFPRDPALV